MLKKYMILSCFILMSRLVQSSQKSLDIKMEKSPSIVEVAAGSLEFKIAKIEQEIKENRDATLTSLRSIHRMIEKYEDELK